jgi:hypothetical protein
MFHLEKATCFAGGDSVRRIVLVDVTGRKIRATAVIMGAAG